MLRMFRQYLYFAVSDRVDALLYSSYLFTNEHESRVAVL